jgi:hypothetical protein
VIIICTTENLKGEMSDVDRETDIWFERDHIIQGKYALMVFPKTCWRRVEELIIPLEQ